MAKLNGLSSIVSELRAERTNLVNELKHVDAALSVLGKVSGGSTHTHAQQPTRIISAASRRKMAQAQKARWAKQPTTNVRAIAKPKRVMSASARRKIAAAQRARWAKVKAGQKKAA
jgi:bisphosphoglycerate-independent phosphoglycerate mutase (AlkP superfamily)